MVNITYHVAMDFERDPEGELVAMDPVEVLRTCEEPGRMTGPSAEGGAVQAPPV
jgi:hypothetical protein